MTPHHDTASQAALGAVQMLPGVDAWQYLEARRASHPALYRLLSARVDAARLARAYADMGGLSTHFESKLDGGRGDVYRSVQNEQFLIRSVGYLSLFDLAMAAPRTRPPDQAIVLDALGGNGTLTRIVQASRPATSLPLIITNDVSARMVESALAQGLPATRQPAQDLFWFDDQTFDAVIMAYGTHHVPVEQRARAVAEAYRVLRPGGRLVLQDFEVGCPTTAWYSDVLDRYTTTGHQFTYFTRAEFTELLDGAHFADVSVFPDYDPFILVADTPEAARRELLEYVFTLFALERLPGADGPLDDAFWHRLEGIVRETATFGRAELPGGRGVTEFTVRPAGTGYAAELPRLSLVATARRPT